MISYTEKALELVKKFAQGAPCKVNFGNIESTMFHPHLVVIAKKLGLKEITEEVVKKYWFEIHNKLVAKRFKMGQLDFEQAKNCMVHPKRKEDNIVSVHGGIEISIITEEEAKFLEQNFREALESLQ